MKEPFFKYFPDEKNNNKDVEIYNESIRARIKENEKIIKTCEEAIKDLKRLLILEQEKQKVYKEVLLNED